MSESKEVFGVGRSQEAASRAPSHDSLTKDARAAWMSAACADPLERSRWCAKYADALLSIAEATAWRPIAELKPDDGFVILAPVDEDGEIPEVWSAKQYHLAMSPERTRAFAHLHELASRATHFMKLHELPR